MSIIKDELGKKHFTNIENGKDWWIEITDTGFLTCLNNGKVKETICKSDYEIKSKSASAMRAQMKKGFVYKNVDAAPFEVISHVYVTDGYTGFMPIGASENRDDFFVVGFKKDIEEEFAINIMPTGEILNRISLGKNRLSYNIRLSENDKLYLNNNYRLECLNTLSGELTFISDTLYGQKMILDGNGKLVLYYDGEKLVLSDGNKAIWEKEVDFEKNESYHFTYYCFGVISRDGKYFLYRCNVDGYYLVDVENNTEKFIENKALNPFFIWNSEYFVIGDKYYSVKDASSIDEELLPFKLPYMDNFPKKESVVISNGKYIAMREKCHELNPGDGVEIWDCETMKLLTTIKDEFIVRNFSMAFAGNNLVVYSDYGVVSVYRIER